MTLINLETIIELYMTALITYLVFYLLVKAYLRKKGKDFNKNNLNKVTKLIL